MTIAVDHMISNQMVLAQTQQKAATTLTEVMWCGQSLSVKSDKLRVVLVRLKELAVEVKVSPREVGSIQWFVRQLSIVISYTSDITCNSL